MKKTILLVLLSLTTSACVFRPIPKCEVPEKSALEACNEPLELPEKHTYQEALKAHITDKESLSKCKIKHNTVVEALKSCNRRIDKYNEAKGELDDQQQ